MPAELTDSVRAFLQEARFGVIGTSNPDGSVQQAALWYALEGDAIMMNTGTASKKVRNLRRDPRAAVTVVDSGQARHVTLLGTVSFDDSHVLEDLTTLASRYAGPQAGPGIAQSIAKVPHITLRLHIERVQTFGKI